MIRSILDGMNLKSRSRRQNSRRWHSKRLGGLEGLEGRLLLSGDASIYVVNLTSSTGVGSGNTGDLVYVVGQANADPNTAGSVIEFDPTVFGTAQTITLTSTLTLDETAGPEVIDGPGGGLVTVSGGNAVEVLSVSDGVTASISGLSTADGLATGNGGGIYNDGSLTLTSVGLSGNVADGNGGGLYNLGMASLSDCTLTGNQSTSSAVDTGGGAIFNAASGVLNLAGSSMTDNTAGENGGGLFSNGMATLVSCTISGNTAAIFGGGLVNYPGGTLNLTSSTLSGNTASFQGGGLATAGTAMVTDCTITGNSSVAGGGVVNSGAFTGNGLTFDSNHASGVNGFGGAIDNRAPATLDLNDCDFTGNTGGATGGAIFNSGSGSISGSRFTGNSAGDFGGGICVYAGALTIINSSVTGNTSSFDGGGVDVVGNNYSYGKLTMTGVTVSGNSAPQGGGVANAGVATLTDCTIAGNTAASYAGALFNLAEPSVTATTDLTLIACTVTGSSAGFAGGGLYNYTDSAAIPNVSLVDSIVADNTLTSGGASDITGNSAGDVTGSYNLIGIGGSGGITNGVNNNIVLTSLTGLGLAPLGDYGGPTETVALLPGSPAIGNGGGVSITTDQRGFPLATPVDIGAFQTQLLPLVVNTTFDGVGSPVGDMSLRQALNVANLLTTDVTITFDPTVFSTPQTITLTDGTLVLSNTQATVTIDGPTTGGLTISGGNAVEVIQVDSGVTASLADLTISGGLADNGGGIDNGGTLAIASCTIAQNTASAGGGGIYSSGDLTLVNTTIDANTAAVNGGGAFFIGGIVTIVNSTIADNTIPGGSAAGAGLYFNTGTDTLDNTIVALNSDILYNTTPADDIAGTPLSTSSAYNLIGTGGSGGLVNGTNGNQVGVANPLLGVLANNGGPTDTLALLAGSPALGAGSPALAVDPSTGLPLTYDQRGAGYPRTVDGLVDIGAFEFSATVSTPTVYTVNLTSANGTGSGDSGDLVYVIGLADADPNPAGSVIDFDPTVFATEQTINLTGTLMLSPPAGPLVINGPSAGVIIDGNFTAGVFQVARNASVTLTSLTITDGSSTTYGGGILINPGASVSLAGDQFVGDLATYYGGAIYNNGGTLTIADSTFTDNAAAYGLGGAIDNLGVLSITSSTFTGGAAFQGGAIDNMSGSLTLTNSTLEDNSGTEGGAIYNNAVATITGSTIADDSTSFVGGGIANDLNGTMTITNSTIAFNYAAQGGGGINQVGGGGGQGGGLTLINATIAYNSVGAGGSGGGILASTGTATLYNTIVALNTAGTGKTATASDIAGTVASVSAYNLVGTGGSGNLSATDNVLGVTDPGLATSLADNGGPTPTIAVLAGSPAIGAGSSSITGVTVPTTDQRGVARPSSSITVGAYQYVAPVITPVITVVSTDPLVVLNPSSSAPIDPITVVTLDPMIAASPTAATNAVTEVSPVTEVAHARKKLPHGGSASAFHQTRKSAALKRSVAAVTNHARVSIKHARATVKKK